MAPAQAEPGQDDDGEDDDEEDEVGGGEERSWSPAETAVGAKFIGAIVEIDNALRSSRSKTPTPEWAKSDQYQLQDERRIRTQLDEVSAKIQTLEKENSELHGRLADAGILKGLLFETGHALEESVLEALGVLGFEAKGFKEGQSEFDAVFVSPTGERLIGEAEGKDNKAVNIDKMDQLERNIREEFALREGTEYAKGVLFGNAFRLTPVEERGDFSPKSAKPQPPGPRSPSCGRPICSRWRDTLRST